jgi:hypothetical protein
LIERELRARRGLFLLALAVTLLGFWGGEIGSHVDRNASFFNDIFFDIFSNFSAGPPTYYPLLAPLFLNGLFFGSLAYSLLIGWLQVSSESRSGVEPFLLFQPVARGRILLSKFLAGTLLHLGLLLTLFALHVLWVSTPWGHFGPFRWEMAYPGWVQIVAAFPAYPAALWAMAGRGRERFLGFAAVFVALVLGLFFANLCVPYWTEAGILGVALILLWGAAHAYAEREI